MPLTLPNNALLLNTGGVPRLKVRESNVIQRRNKTNFTLNQKESDTSSKNNHFNHSSNYITVNLNRQRYRTMF